MPLYTYRCQECHKTEDVVRTVDARDDAPTCHGPMRRVLSLPMIATGFQPYRTVAYDKETGRPMQIRTRDEHRAFLNRNGYEEVGNDRSMAPHPLEHQQPAKDADFKFDPDTQQAESA